MSKERRRICLHRKETILKNNRKRGTVREIKVCKICKLGRRCK